MLLVKKPSYREWLIAVSGAFFVVVLVSALEFWDMQERGALVSVDGSIKLNKKGRSQILEFVGQDKTGVCSFSGCAQHVSMIDGKAVSVKLDERGKIFEINEGGKIYFGAENIEERKNNLLFTVLVCLVFSAGLLFLLPKKRG